MSLSRCTTWLLISVLAPLGLPISRADHPKPLAIDDALAQLQFGLRIPIDISADGRWVAYTLEDSRRRERTGDRRFMNFSRTGAPVEAHPCF
jgi:hypothetical protein